MATFKANAKSEVIRRVRELVQAVAGRGPSSSGIGERVMRRVGESFLADVQQDFATKSAGGTGKVGGKWPAQSKKYLAYGRPPEGREKTVVRKAAGVKSSDRYAPGGNNGLLSADQNRRWKAIFAFTKRRLMLSTSEAEASQRAAQIAWATLKREGARTKLQVYGSRTVPILRDTDSLYDSFSPHDAEAVFEASAGSGQFGSKHPFAAAHNYGTGKLPRRQIIPDGDDDMPDEWADNMAAAALEEVAGEIKLLLEVA